MQYCFMNIVFATNNRHKVDEAQAILGKDFTLTTPKDLKLFEEIPEPAGTLQGNAFMKAHFLWERFHVACFADDTGLEVEALNGAPGVYSARYAGEEHDSKANTQKLQPVSTVFKTFHPGGWIKQSGSFLIIYFF